MGCKDIEEIRKPEFVAKTQFFCKSLLYGSGRNWKLSIFREKIISAQKMEYVNLFDLRVTSKFREHRIMIGKQKTELWSVNKNRIMAGKKNELWSANKKQNYGW